MITYKSIVVWFSIVLFLTACQDRTAPVTHSTFLNEDQIVILGTYNWDVESASLDSGSKSDFWYQRVDETHGNLIAQNGTTLEIVHLPYEQIDKKSILQLPALRDGRINSFDLKPGTVAVFKTVEGNYGKLKIKGFKSLHDFDFKEAQKYLDESWKHFVLKKPNTKKYHLVVEYKLYKN